MRVTEVELEQRRNERAGGKREIPEKTRGQVASSGTFLTFPLAIEPGPPWWEESDLTTATPRPLLLTEHCTRLYTTQNSGTATPRRQTTASNFVVASDARRDKQLCWLASHRRSVINIAVINKVSSFHLLEYRMTNWHLWSRELAPNQTHCECNSVIWSSNLTKCRSIVSFVAKKFSAETSEAHRLALRAPLAAYQTSLRRGGADGDLPTPPAPLPHTGELIGRSCHHRQQTPNTPSRAQSTFTYCGGHFLQRRKVLSTHRCFLTCCYFTAAQLSGRGVAVVRLLASPPRRTGFNARRGRPRDFRTRESFRTMPLASGFSRGSPVSHRIHALLHIHLTSPSSAHKSSMLEARIPSLTQVEAGCRPYTISSSHHSRPGAVLCEGEGEGEGWGGAQHRGRVLAEAALCCVQT
ncbi:hypothetical protein PR048_016377 [Dryococelus australis]|uniref:Uncharacterized protein n=1 Tax=Dryococelus australis TaxID=614101 RepID=A0ABQ9HJK0_9NEOP|nr:hypothetical protein PR048_016377 [Dryococelus australis]